MTKAKSCVAAPDFTPAITLTSDADLQPILDMFQWMIYRDTIFDIVGGNFVAPIDLLFGEPDTIIYQDRDQANLKRDKLILYSRYSIYSSIVLEKRVNQYKVAVGIKRKTYHLGLAKTAEEAYALYLRKAPLKQIEFLNAGY